MMTACKQVKIERRCQEQRHHCLHSLVSTICTSDSHPNPAVGWDGVGFDFQQHQTGAWEQVWQLPDRTNLVWQCQTSKLITFNCVHIYECERYILYSALRKCFLCSEIVSKYMYMSVKVRGLLTGWSPPPLRLASPPLLESEPIAQSMLLQR